MAIDEHLIITLRVAGKAYRLKVKRENEKIFRDAAGVIDRKINQYRNYFSGTDQEQMEDMDYVLMTSIQALSEHVELETRNNRFEDKIKALTAELDEYLKK